MVDNIVFMTLHSVFMGVGVRGGVGGGSHGTPLTALQFSRSLVFLLGPCIEVD